MEPTANGKFPAPDAKVRDFILELFYASHSGGQVGRQELLLRVRV